MELWEQFLKGLEQELGTAAVNRWLRPLQVIDFDAANLYLKAENAFQVLWFEKEIRKIAKERFLNQRQQPIKIHIEAQDLPERIKKNAPFTEPTYTSTPLDPDSTLDHFVATPENQLLLQFLKQFKPGSDNPLFFFGKSGVGKTHLLMGLAAHLNAQGWKTFFTHAETFTEHVVSAIRKGNVNPLRQIYRNVDALLLDDVHCLARKAATQEEFFHTFNHLHSRGCPIILTSPVPPSCLTEIEPRLISRFEWGILFEVHAPSRELLYQIAKKRSIARRLTLSEEILEELFQIFKSSPKALFSAIDALALRLPKRVYSLTREELYSRLRDLIAREKAEQITPEKIAEQTALYFGVRLEEILGKSQSKEISLPRQIAIFLCRQELRLPFLSIGKCFERDHSTIIKSVQLIEKKKGAEPAIARALFEIKEKIQSRS